LEDEDVGILVDDGDDDDDDDDDDDNAEGALVYSDDGEVDAADEAAFEAAAAAATNDDKENSSNASVARSLFDGEGDPRAAVPRRSLSFSEKLQEMVATAASAANVGAPAAANAVPPTKPQYAAAGRRSGAVRSNSSSRLVRATQEALQW
jgi:hypothetical protein